MQSFDRKDRRFGGTVFHEPIELDLVLGGKAGFVAGTTPVFGLPFQTSPTRS
jgi:hypothetical protein